MSAHTVRIGNVHPERRLFHASGILVVLVYWFVLGDRRLAAGLLWGVVAGQLVVDLLRSRIPAVQQLFVRLFRRILAPKDERGLNTSTMYFAGCALAVTLAAKPEACAGILALALGDPSAAIAGQAVRSPRWRGKSLAGSLACLVAATLACWIFVPLGHALVGGLAATVLEALAGSKLDNLAIPAGTALVLRLL